VQSLESVGGAALVPARRVAEPIPLEAGLARKAENAARRLPTPQPGEEEEAARRELEEAGDASDFRSVAPPVMSFAQGRRR
jgi:hypothetical protein